MARLALSGSLVVLLLCATPAFGYYDDVHYALTYYVARAVGYTQEQAYRVASACVSVDYSPATEPVQAGISAIYELPRAQEPRWRFHAFRNEIKFKDVVGNGADAAAADQMIREQRTQLWNQAKELGNPGVFLHFFEDEVPHARYGTRAGHWPVTEERNVQLAYKYDLPIGSTTDWLSYRSLESNLTLIRQTASSLTTFLQQVSPHQPPRALDVAKATAVVNALRAVNPAPVPLEGKSIDVLRRGKFTGTTGAMETESAIAYLANQADLSPAETENIQRHLRGTDLGKAIEKVNEALGSSELEPEFMQYDYDGFGRLRNAGQADKFTLTGTLRVSIERKASSALASTDGTPLKLSVSLAKTRPPDQEVAIMEVPVPAGEPIVIERLPIGELVLQVSDPAGTVLLRQGQFLLRRDQVAKLTVEERPVAENDGAAAGSGPGAWAGTWIGSSTVKLTASGDTVTGSDLWVDANDGKPVPHRSTGQWKNCRISGAEMSCDWTAQYTDADKDMDRHGTLKATLSGDTMHVVAVEGAPTATWRVAPYASSMHEGKIWDNSYTRKK
jgi:hypothetical protein